MIAADAYQSLSPADIAKAVAAARTGVAMLAYFHEPVDDGGPLAIALPEGVRIASHTIRVGASTRGFLAMLLDRSRLMIMADRHRTAPIAKFCRAHRGRVFHGVTLLPADPDRTLTVSFSSMRGNPDLDTSRRPRLEGISLLNLHDGDLRRDGQPEVIGTYSAGYWRHGDRFYTDVTVA